MKCFYHNADFDGKCSGALIKKRYRDCEMIGINHGDDFPWHLINDPLEVVYMVDFSLQPFINMQKLNKLCMLRWIDHHSSAIIAAGDNNFKCSDTAVLDINFAACELTWFHLNKTKSVSEMPVAVYLLGRYDVWKHLTINNCLEFQYGMRVFEDTSPTNTAFWYDLLSNGGNLTVDNIKFWSRVNSRTSVVDEIVETGKNILQYQRNENKMYADACSFEGEFEGYRFVAINRGLTNSQMFDSVYDESEHELMITFVRRPTCWTVSLYTTHKNIDVSQIATRYGGGGHKGAAGFQCDNLPFLT